MEEIPPSVDYLRVSLPVWQQLGQQQDPEASRSNTFRISSAAVCEKLLLFGTESGHVSLFLRRNVVSGSSIPTSTSTSISTTSRAGATATSVSSSSSSSRNKFNPASRGQKNQRNQKTLEQEAESLELCAEKRAFEKVVYCVSLSRNFALAGSAFAAAVLDLKNLDTVWRLDLTERCLSCCLDPGDRPFPRYASITWFIAKICFDNYIEV